VEHPTTIAVDLAKSVFEIAVSKEPGRVCQRKRLTRGQMAAFFANRPPATVLMEACGTAHYWGRLLRGWGHRVLLLPANPAYEPIEADDIQILGRVVTVLRRI